MLNCVNHITTKVFAITLLWLNAFVSQAETIRSGYDDPPTLGLTYEQPYYAFSYEVVDQMLQMIEKHRNFRPSNLTLEYGVMFYPEMDVSTKQLKLVAKACVIMPREAVPLNLPGNHFSGTLHGEHFFDEGFIKTFKQNPAEANGAAQAYTFTVLYENQVQTLLSARGTTGIKAYQVKVDYGDIVEPTSTSTFYNLNIINDVPNMEFGEGALFMLTIPCPPFWKT